MISGGKVNHVHHKLLLFESDMNKDLFYAIFWAVLTIASLFLVRFGVYIWMMFLIFSISDFVAYRHQKRKESSGIVAGKDAAYGKLGLYIFDSGEMLYGLYIEINNKPVFIHAAEDRFIDERKRWAAAMFENTKTINKNFQSFVSRNPGLQGVNIYCIEYCSKDLTEGEIVWDYDAEDKILPEVVLWGLDFVIVKTVPFWKRRLW
jgi:hypothetical protein